MSTVLPLYRRALGDSWRSLIGWSLGVGAAIALYVPLFPSIGGNPDVQALLDTMPPELVSAIGYDSIGTGAGYVHSTFYGLIGFALIVIAATSWSTAAIAGDEETGSLELTLAHGVTRAQVVLERAAAVFTRLLWLAVLSVLLVLALNDGAGLEIEFGNLVAEAAAFLGLAMLSAAFGLAVGALTGRRVFATTAAAGVAVLGYALNAVANQSEDLDWLHAWTPYGWAYGELPLRNGADWPGLALLYGVSAALVAVATLALNRRDIAA
jgi:ABC-2 type transport system permease protein